MILVNFDIGGTNIKGAIFVDAKVVQKWHFPALAETKMMKTLYLIEEEIKKQMRILNFEKIDGIGFAYAGLVNSIDKKSIDSNGKYLDAHKIDYSLWAKQKFNCAFLIENDARLACIGEWKYGAGVQSNDMSILTLGTGIGSSSVIRGKVLRGKYFKAGVLGGHFTIDINASVCNCGNLGCAEAQASTWKLLDLKNKIIGAHNKSFNAYLEKYGLSYNDVGFEHLFKASQEGSKESKQLIESCIKIWSAAAVNLIHAYDSEMIILQGGILKGDENLIVNSMQEYIDTYCWVPEGKVKVVKGTLDELSALYGLHYLFINDPKLECML